MTVGSAAVEEVLLALKLAFLVLLYLFIWRIVRTASRDIRTPQDTVVARAADPGHAAAGDPGAAAGPARRRPQRRAADRARSSG